MSVAASCKARQAAQSDSAPCNAVNCRSLDCVQESRTLIWQGLERALDDPQASANGASTRGQQQDRLDSWKKIASYLKRDVSTVQRWERREAMPVHRHLHHKKGSVFAFRSELDAWWESRGTRLSQGGAGESERPAQILQIAEDASRTTAPRVHPTRLVRLALGAGVVLIAGTLAWFAAQPGYFWRSPLA